MRLTKWIAAAAAFLAFAGELMAGKKLLPEFGGAAYVWCGTVLFFQLFVIAAYYGSRRLGQSQRQGEILLGLGASGFLTLLPLAIHVPWLPLVVQPLVGLIPFAGLATALFCTTPLLHQLQEDRHDFSIYAWSNGGALASLIAYPLLIEPNVDLSVQNWAWAAGGFVVCVFVWRNARPVVTRSAESSGLGKTRWQWWILPGVSSATMLATTNQISYEAAAGPLAWAMPLAIFLATYVWAFSANRQKSLGVLATVGLVALTASRLSIGARSIELLVFALVGGGISMLACHVWLAGSRDANTHGFYSATAISGAVGSAVVLLVIPQVTRTPIEFPILTLSVLSIAGFLWSGRFARLIPATCAVVAIGITFITERQVGAHDVARVRSLYGCWRVTKQPNTELYALISNTTTHGQQDRRNPGAGLLYYGKETGLGRLLSERLQSTNAVNIGVVGLGAGTISSFLRPQDSITYFELDPEAENLARTWFTYLDDNKSRVLIGDGRQLLEREPQSFDIIILDAFSGDAIPTHLLTLQAAEVYRRHLKQGGALAIHITNAHVDLRPVATGLAQALSTGCEFVRSGKVSWAILRQGAPPPAGASRLWTDQRTSLIGLLKQRE